MKGNYPERIVCLPKKPRRHFTCWAKKIESSGYQGLPSPTTCPKRKTQGLSVYQRQNRSDSRSSRILFSDFQIFRLTSRLSDPPWYHGLVFNHRPVQEILSMIRTWEAWWVLPKRADELVGAYEKNIERIRPKRPVGPNDPKCFLKNGITPRSPVSMGLRANHYCWRGRYLSGACGLPRWKSRIIGDPNEVFGVHRTSSSDRGAVRNLDREKMAARQGWDAIPAGQKAISTKSSQRDSSARACSTDGWAEQLQG
ncbi:MAG: hypothetical protein CM1200mP18_07180 [Gammaproteobacteria bacterium]|nr:MAG: hypothetical protein CM1200mP18_07180 [Gammaproteobacteria bacterium]